jgi:uncharacterized protein YjiS (DUF1127 family)
MESTMSNRQLYGEPLRLRQYRPLAEPSPSLWETLRAAWGRHRSRRRIAQLDPQMLKDIGVSYAEAEAEANKPFWRD